MKYFSFKKIWIVWSSTKLRDSVHFFKHVSEIKLHLVVEMKEIQDNLVDIFVYRSEWKLMSHIYTWILNWRHWWFVLKGEKKVIQRLFIQKNQCPYPPSICNMVLYVCMTVFMWVHTHVCFMHGHTLSPTLVLTLNPKQRAKALKVLKLMVWILSSPVRCVKSL